MCNATGQKEKREDTTAAPTPCLHEHDSSRLEEDTLGGLKALLVQFGRSQQDVSCLSCSHRSSVSGHDRPNSHPTNTHGSPRLH